MAILIFVLLFINILLPHTYAQAVVPPDFIYSIGPQVAQIFAGVVLFFSLILGTIKGFIVRHTHFRNHPFIAKLVLLLLVIAISSGAAYGYYIYEQKRLLSEWKEQTKRLNEERVINDRSLLISKADFASLVNSDHTMFILDIRENEEYELGRFPGSTHIRLADLLAGEWKTLPTNQPIYILCWSGIRGQNIAQFLQDKHLNARYLEGGADGWAESGGTWEGQIKFLSHYTDKRYSLVFETDEMKKLVQEEGVIPVDVRAPDKFKRHHIPGSVSAPLMYTPSEKVSLLYDSLKPGDRSITVCDDEVSCFYAKVAGVQMEKRGILFLGRYVKPWDWQ